MGAFFKGETPGGYPLFELMSSGLTHHASTKLKGYLNRKYGKGNFFLDQNFGMVDLTWGEDILVNLRAESHSGKYSLNKKFKIVNGIPVLI